MNMNDDTLYQHLAGEAGHITWQELQPHFARGVLIVVSETLDLIEVATRFAQDASDEVGLWTDQALVARVSDDHARGWALTNPLLLAVVVAPWVLVQESRRH